MDVNEYQIDNFSYPFIPPSAACARVNKNAGRPKSVLHQHLKIETSSGSLTQG